MRGDRLMLVEQAGRMPTPHKVNFFVGFLVRFQAVLEELPELEREDILGAILWGMPTLGGVPRSWMI